MPTAPQLTPRRKLFYAILANIIIPLAGMSTDIYLPSLPAIARHFHSVNASAQYTVTAFVLAMGLSQLIAGPISDAYGRRKLLLIALSTQILAIIAILFAPTISRFIVFRFIQGAASAFMIVPARAIVNDIFEGEALKKQFNYFTISFAAGPIIAPFIGGYLQHYFGWQANFIFILIYALLLLITLITAFHETIRKTRTFSISHLWQNYHTLLCNRYFIGLAFFASMMWGFNMIFNVAGPFLIQNTLHQNAIVYGHVALVMGFAWFIGNTLNRLLFHYNNHIKTQVALWLTLLVTATLFGFAVYGLFNLLSVVIPVALMAMLSGLLFPIYIAESLITFPEMAATANAFVFGMAWLTVTIFSIIATFLKVHSLLPLAITYLVIALFNLAIYALLRYIRPIDAH